MLKRAIEIIIALSGLMLTGPLLLLAALAIYLQDFHSPLYIAPRIGKNGKHFSMVKLRSMRIHADRSKIDSTSANDPRLTTIGKIIRAYKLDELMQLWNVLKGDMTLVGPRPNVQREVDLYTTVERKLLEVKPGITDLSSIVFADLNEILRDSQDANLAYNQLVRPWKSRLGILYIENQSRLLDIKLIFLTITALFSHQVALRGVETILQNLQADRKLIEVVRRNQKLTPFPPPGATEIVTSR